MAFACCVSVCSRLLEAEVTNKGTVVAMLQWHLYLSPQFASQSIALSFDAVCLTHTVNTMFILTRLGLMVFAW